MLVIFAMHIPDSMADDVKDATTVSSSAPATDERTRRGECPGADGDAADELHSVPDTLASIRCLIERGHTALAVLLLQQLLAMDESNPEATALLDKQLVHAIRARRANSFQTPWGALSTVSGWLALELGHDSNINRATSAEVIDIPLLNYRSLALPELLIERSSGFAGLTGGATVRVPLTSALETSVHAQAGLRGNFSEKAYLPHNYRVAARLDGSLGDTTLGVGVSAAQQWVAKYRLLERTAARADVVTNVFQAVGLSLSAEWGSNTYPQFNGVKTRERSVEARAWYRPFNLHFGAYWGEESSRDAIKDLDRVFDGMSVGWRHAFSDTWRLAVDATAGRSRYGQFSRLFATRRTDRQVDLALALQIHLADNWSLTPKVVAERNDSSITLNRYRRTQYLAELRRDF